MKLDPTEHNKALLKLPKLHKPKHTALGDDGWLVKTGGYTKRQMREYALRVLADYKAQLVGPVITVDELLEQVYASPLAWFEYPEYGLIDINVSHALSSEIVDAIQHYYENRSIPRKDWIKQVKAKIEELGG
jgi:hypothetical protein